MMNFIDTAADRFNEALRTQPFATSVHIYSKGSAAVATVAFVATMITASTPAIAIPAAIISLAAAYVFYKTVVNSIAADEEVCGNGGGLVNREFRGLQVTQERCADLFNHKMRQVFVIACLIKIKNYFS